MDQNFHQRLTKDSQPWEAFEEMIGKSFHLIWEAKTFRKYLNHVFSKFAKNGYQRLEFRAFLTELSVYNSAGEEVEKLPIEKYIEIVDE